MVWHFEDNAESFRIGIGGEGDGCRMNRIDRALLYQIDTPHFCAGVLVQGEHVVEAAPILGWSVGKTWSRVEAWCKSKRLKTEWLKTEWLKTELVERNTP